MEARALVATIEDVEPLDPHVSSEQLLYRLFRERGVRVFRSRVICAPSVRARARGWMACCEASRRTTAMPW